MTDQSDAGGADGTLTTEEAFALLGNEIRQEILVALSERNGDSLNTPVLSFSELYARIDADVNTSQFNYHLQELLGHFVEAREGTTAHPNDVLGDEQGYALRPEGLLVVWTVRSDTAPGDPAVGPFDAGFACHHCDAAVEARYENSVFVVECPGCGYHYEYNPTPPGVVHGTDDPETVLDRVAAYNRTVRGAAARGVCPFCAGSLDHRFVDAAATNYPGHDRRAVFIHRACEHCGFIDYLTVGEFLLPDPRLIAYCLERGVDVTAGRPWEHAFVATDEAVTVASTDPWRVEFALALGADTLHVTVDEALSTTATVQ